MRALKQKCSHPLRGDLQLCLWDLLDDGDNDERPSKSKEWVKLVDHGGLCWVNITFEKNIVENSPFRCTPCIPSCTVMMYTFFGA